jgi:hypothetical protein
MILLGDTFSTIYTLEFHFSRKLTEVEKDYFNDLYITTFTKRQWTEAYLTEEDGPDDDTSFIITEYSNLSHWPWLNKLITKLRAKFLLHKFERKYNVMAELRHIELIHISWSGAYSE